MAGDIVHLGANTFYTMPGAWPNYELPGNPSILDDIGKDTLSLEGRAASEAQSSLLSSISEKVKSIGSGALNAASELIGLNKLKEEAVEDMQRPPEKLPRRDNFANGIINGIATNPQQLIVTASNPEYTKAFNSLTKERQAVIRAVCSSPEFINGDAKRKIAILIGLSGAGPTKLCQIASSDESLDPKIREILGQLKSSGVPTRDNAATQKHVDAIYGNGKYTIKGSVGVASVGEVSLAIRDDGQEVIIKNLKNGINKSSLKAEWQIMRGLVSSSCKDKSKLAYQLHTVDNLYKSWIHELDFGEEAKNAAALADGATRYKVAQALELGYEIDPITRVAKYSFPTSMVQEVAEGISLDQLSGMLKVHNESPSSYKQQFQHLFEKHPWLEDPKTWMHEIPSVYLNSFNEQTLLRTKKGCVVASHGDPHGGNVFVHYNQSAQKLEVTYIDAGLVATRDSKKAASHLGLLVNSMLGNSDALARSMVDSADRLPDRPKEEIVQEIKTILDSKLFKARVNLTDSKYNNQLFDSLMEEKGVLIPESETAFFKAQMQAVMNYKELSKLTGQIENNYLLDSLPDIARGATRLISQEPIEAAHHLLPVLPHLATDGKSAIRNACQFFVRRA